MADPLTDTLNRRAAFAQNFPNAGNLDQRRRFAQDISDASERQKERDAADFEALQQRDPQLMNAVTGRMKEGRLRVEGQQRQALGEARLDRQLNRDVTIDDLNERKFKLQEKNAVVQRQKAALDIDRATRELDDTFAYEVGEMQLRDEFGPGTEEYRQGVAELAASLPYLKKDIRQESLKEVGFEDPDAAYRDVSQRLQEARKQGVNFRETVKTKVGTMTISGSGETADDLNREYANVLKLWNDSKLKAADPAVVKYFEDRARALEPKLKELGQVTAAPVQTGVTAVPSNQSTSAPASVPATQATTIWRTDAQGNRWEYDANKQPTGKYIPAK